MFAYFIDDVSVEEVTQEMLNKIPNTTLLSVLSSTIRFL
jgi:hypothetical protein